MIVVTVSFIVISVFIVAPLSLLAAGKLFRVKGVNLARAYLATLFLLVAVPIFCVAVAILMSIVKMPGVLAAAVVFVSPVPPSVWIITWKLRTSVGKATGIYVFSLILALSLSALFRTFVAQAYKFPSTSMEPTLMRGDCILANKFIYRFSSPERGDIVVFPLPEDPSKDFLKRVLGMPGDKVQIRDKKLYINDEPVDDPYGTFLDPHVMPGDARPRDNFGPVTVPPKSFFVMGDNRDHSYDSRFWGFVDSDTVKGKVTDIYWSWDADSQNVRWNRIGKTIE